MEVIYTPPWQEIATVVKLAMEEDADVIGISSLATDHLIVPKLMEALRAAGLADIQVIVGGIVPAKDEKTLLAAGVARVFHPGAALDDIVTAVRSRRRATPSKEPRHEQVGQSHRRGRPGAVPGTVGTGIRRWRWQPRAAAQPFGCPDQAAVHAARLVGRGLRREPGLPGRISLHTRHLPDDVPRP
jgi:methylmalonyl-CoA mutase C-terminal domain/subunit